MIATELFYDQERKGIYRGDVRLTGVTSVIKSVIPTDYSGVDPAVLENARLRGVELDALFSAYVSGTLTEIPAGTRKDVYDPDTGDGLLQKLMPWWDAQGFGLVRTQVMLADDTVAGTCDILGAEMILDLKAVSKLQPTYGLQLGAYFELADDAGIKTLGVIHVTAALKTPKLVRYDVEQCFSDWTAIRRAWSVAKRLGGKER